LNNEKNNLIKKTSGRAATSFALVLALIIPLLCGCSIAGARDEAAAPLVTPLDENLVVIQDAQMPDALSGEDDAAPEESDAGAILQTSNAGEETPAPSISATTGRILSEDAVYRPVLIVIDNAAQSRPQTGLMLADVVYEIPLDRTDHATRYLAVFSDEIPRCAGPVRDSRAYLADVAAEWGGLYVSAGDPENIPDGYSMLQDAGLELSVKNEGDAAPFFYTDKTVTAIEEHTVFFKALEYADAYYDDSGAVRAERFLFESNVYYEKGKAFESVGIPFTSSDAERVVFTYDENTNLMTRSDKNSKNVLGVSKTLTPADNVLGYENEPISVQNLIVQYVRISSFDTTFRTIAVTGSGDCEYFINGQHVIGTWSRPTIDDTTTYQLYDGTIIRLEPGNTWIEMMPVSHKISVR
jgi:hypothetical protein